MLELEWNLEIIVSDHFVDKETDYMTAQGPRLLRGRYEM